jgi:hypothetical protein
MDNVEDGDNESHCADSGPTPDGPINVSDAAQRFEAELRAAAPVDATCEHNHEAAAPDVEPGGADLNGRFQDLCKIIQNCTAPKVRSKKWRFLEARPLRIDMPPADFVAALEQDCTAEALIDLGLYERVGEELRLPGWLDGDAHLYVAIDKSNKTIKFTRGDHFLFPILRAAVDLALERIEPDSTQVPATLFIVDSDDSVEVLRQLGLPAVSGAGLEALGSQDIERIFSGDQRSDFAWRYYLLLLDLDVAGLDNRPTATIGEVINRLADAAEVYGIDPGRRFGVCRPSACQLHLLERTIAFEASAKICQLFEKWSAAAKSITINNWRTHFDAKAATFTVARAALIRALQMSHDISRRAAVLEALPAYRLATSGTIIPNFNKDFDRASHPMHQLESIAIVEYAENFFNGDPLVVAAEAVLKGQAPSSVCELENETLQQRQRSLNEIRRIYRDRKQKP